MRIIFYTQDEKHTVNHYSKDNLYNSSGFSGSFTALIEMTNKLAELGHDVIVYGNSETYNDRLVKYIACDDIDKIDWNIDWFCPMFYFFDLKYHKHNIHGRLNPNKTKILLWGHTILFDEVVQYYKERFNVCFQAVSSFVANEYKHILPENKIWVIPNCISTDIFKKDDINTSTEKKGNWIFHSTFERGGKIALNIFRKVKSVNTNVANKIKIASYYLENSQYKPLLNNEDEEFVGSMSKKELRNLLIKSDYYMYPLILDDGRVCHDTFAMSILEALACGVIVFVWDVACIPQVYGDLVVRIPVPEHARVNYNPYGRFGSCPWMLSDEAQQLFIDKLFELESMPEKKEEIRRKGIEWSHSLTWDKYAKEMEHQLLTH